MRRKTSRLFWNFLVNQLPPSLVVRISFILCAEGTSKFLSKFHDPYIKYPIFMVFFQS